jgi:membrane protein YdbS with pleckstrin-like domain
MSDPDDPAEADADGSPSETTGERDASTDAEAGGTPAVQTGAGETARTDDAASADTKTGDDHSVGTSAATIEELDEELVEETVGELRHLDPKVRLYWVASRLFGGVFLAGLAAVIFQFAGPEFGVVETPGELPVGFAMRTVLVGVGAFLLFGGLAALHAVLYYRSWRYEVREDSLYLTRGVFTRVQTVAPYVRVQHIDARRGPVERVLGLSTLVVYTAGSRGADVTVPGLTDDRADELQTALKRLAIESEEEDAV